MNLIKKIKKYFSPREIIQQTTHEREFRELLRENLQTISVDVFHFDDPVIHMTGPTRKEYLAYFYKLEVDKKLIDRIKFLINKQANLTLKNSKDGILDTAGVMKMDGLSLVKDDIERLSGMFLKEEAELGKSKPLSGYDSLRGI